MNFFKKNDRETKSSHKYFNIVMMCSVSFFLLILLSQVIAQSQVDLFLSKSSNIEINQTTEYLLEATINDVPILFFPANVTIREPDGNVIPAILRNNDGAKTFDFLPTVYGKYIVDVKVELGNSLATLREDIYVDKYTNRFKIIIDNYKNNSLSGRVESLTGENSESIYVEVVDEDNISIEEYHISDFSKDNKFVINHKFDFNTIYVLKVLDRNLSVLYNDNVTFIPLNYLYVNVSETEDVMKIYSSRDYVKIINLSQFNLNNITQIVLKNDSYMKDINFRSNDSKIIFQMTNIPIGQFDILFFSDEIVLKQKLVVERNPQLIELNVTKENIFYDPILKQLFLKFKINVSDMIEDDNAFVVYNDEEIDIANFGKIIYNNERYTVQLNETSSTFEISYIFLDKKNDLFIEFPILSSPFNPTEILPISKPKYNVQNSFGLKKIISDIDPLRTFRHFIMSKRDKFVSGVYDLRNDVMVNDISFENEKSVFYTKTKEYLILESDIEFKNNITKLSIFEDNELNKIRPTEIIRINNNDVLKLKTLNLKNVSYNYSIIGVRGESFRGNISINDDVIKLDIVNCTQNEYILELLVSTSNFSTKIYYPMIINNDNDLVISTQENIIINKGMNTEVAFEIFNGRNYSTIIDVDVVTNESVYIYNDKKLLTDNNKNDILDFGIMNSGQKTNLTFIVDTKNLIPGDISNVSIRFFDNKEEKWILRQFSIGVERVAFEEDKKLNYFDIDVFSISGCDFLNECNVKIKNNNILDEKINLIVEYKNATKIWSDAIETYLEANEENIVTLDINDSSIISIKASIDRKNGMIDINPENDYRVKLLENKEIYPNVSYVYEIPLSEKYGRGHDYFNIRTYLELEGNESIENLKGVVLSHNSNGLYTREVLIDDLFFDKFNNEGYILIGVPNIESNIETAIYLFFSNETRNLDDSNWMREKIIDNGDSNVELVGHWEEAYNVKSSRYGIDYLYDLNSKKGEKNVIYNLNVPLSSYELYTYYPSDSSFSENTPIEINSIDKSTTVFVNQQIGNDKWRYIGFYEFDPTSSVVVGNKETTGYVVVDAIKLIQVDQYVSMPIKKSILELNTILDNAILNHTIIQTEKVELGKPVKWKQIITGKDTVEIPSLANEIKIKNKKGKIIKKDSEIEFVAIKAKTTKAKTTKAKTTKAKTTKAKTIKAKARTKEGGMSVPSFVMDIASIINKDKIEILTENKSNNALKNKTIDISNILEEDIILEYETPAPTKIEKNLTKNKKQIIIKSDLHYLNISSYTTIKETPKEFVKLYWYIDGVKTDVTLNPEIALKKIDTNNNGLIDRLEWITPHTSTQIFEVEIVILSNLDILDSQKKDSLWIVKTNMNGINDLVVDSNREMFLSDIHCGEFSNYLNETWEDYILYNNSKTGIFATKIYDSKNWSCSYDTILAFTLEDDLSVDYTGTVKVKYGKEEHYIGLNDIYNYTLDVSINNTEIDENSSNFITLNIASKLDNMLIESDFINITLIAIDNFSTSKIIYNVSEYTFEINKRSNLYKKIIVQSLYDKTLRTKTILLNPNIEYEFAFGESIKFLTDNVISTKIYDYKNIELNWTIVNDSNFISFNFDDNYIKPGLYRVEVVHSDYVENIWFTYGLVSVNTQKPMYKPGENINFLVVVLDHEGFVVHSADITIRVETPDGTVVFLTTEDNDLLPNKAGVFLGNSTFNQEGKYLISTIAKTYDGESRINTYVNVQSDYPIDIIRNVPSTIDPFLGSFKNVFSLEPLYDNIEILELIENLPSSFVVTKANDLFVDKSNSDNKLHWMNNETKFYPTYYAQAPLITPYLYTLGNAIVKYRDTNTGVEHYFYENRSWFLAIDPLYKNPKLIDSTSKTCIDTWGFSCATGPSESGGDNTWNTCDSGTGNDESIETMSLNATTAYVGDSVEISCLIDPYNSDDYIRISYYNGTGWKQLYNEGPVGSSGFFTRGATFTVDNISGTHWVRCSIGYRTSSDIDECIDTGSYYDNDDINFTVVEVPEYAPGYNVWNISYLGINLSVGDIIYRDNLYQAFAFWNFTSGINSSFFEHSGDGGLKNYSVLPKNSWTNYTIDTSNTNEFKNVGRINFSFYAEDIGLWNKTSQYYLDLFGYSKIFDSIIEPTTIYPGNYTRMGCKIVDNFTMSPIQNYNVSFYNSTHYLGSNFTQSSGWAYYNFRDYSLGFENITCNIIDQDNIFYTVSNENESVEVLRVVDVAEDAQSPLIIDINSNPNPAASLSKIKIVANVTDNIGIDMVKIFIESPNGTSWYVTMNSLSGDIYYYDFSHTENKGLYTYYIWANDTNGNYKKSTMETFYIARFKTDVDLFTEKDVYSKNEDVNLLSGLILYTEDKEYFTKSLSLPYIIASDDFNSECSGYSSKLFEFNPDDGDADAPWQCGDSTLSGKSCYSGNGCWATSLTGDYFETGDYSDMLISDNISLKGYDSANLSFMHYRVFENPSTAYDCGVVDAQLDGGTWNRLVPAGGYTTACSSGNGGLSSQPSFSLQGSSWEKKNFNLNGYIDNDVAIRYHFSTDDTVGSEGWYIDDFLITGTAEEATTELIDYSFEGNNFSNDIIQLTIKVGITSYTDEASHEVSNLAPKIEIFAYNGTGYEGGHYCSLKDLYGENINSNEYKECLITFYTPNVLGAWNESQNRKLKIRAKNIDTNANKMDEIKYSLVETSIIAASAVGNDLNMNLTGRVYMDVEKFNVKTASWDLLDVIYNQTNTIEAKKYIDLSTLWNPNGWNVSNNEPGEYKANFIMYDMLNNIIVDDDGSNVEDEYLFNVSYNRSIIDIGLLDNNNIISGSSASMRCQVKDPDRDVALNNYDVLFYIDGAYDSTVATNSTGWATLTASNIMSGSYNITCKIDDQNGYFVTDPMNKTDHLRVYPFGYDVLPPVISNLVDGPDPQSKGGIVQFNVTVNDNKKVENVSLFVRSPGSTTYSEYIFNGINIDGFGNGDYQYNFTSTSVDGSYSYYIYALDNQTTPNRVQSALYFFEIENVGALIDIDTDKSIYDYGDKVALNGYTYSQIINDSLGTKNALYLYHDDFEGSSAWTLNYDWEIGAPQGFGGGEGGNPDPVAAFLGTGVLGTDLSSDGLYSANHNIIATSPPCDTSLFESMNLSFVRWLNIESQLNYDEAYIEARAKSTDSWTQIWTDDFETTGAITDNVWSVKEYDMSGFRGNETQVQFRLHTDSGTEYSGWNIDEVSFIGTEFTKYIDYLFGGTDLTIGLMELVVQVDGYVNTGSESGNEPDLQVDVYDNNDFVPYYCKLNEVYGFNQSSSIVSHNCSIPISNSDILNAWGSTVNRRIKLRGSYLQGVNNTNFDQIRWSNLYFNFYSPSYIYNQQAKTFNAKLQLEIYKDGNFIKNIYNSSISLLGNEIFNISNYWNSSLFVINNNLELGTYTAIASLVDGSGSILFNQDGSPMRDEDFFNVEFLKINMNSPQNNSYYSRNNLWYDINLENTYKSSGGWCVYSLDNEANVTMNQVNPTRFKYQNTSIISGEHNIVFACNDTFGKVITTDNINFTVVTPEFLMEWVNVPNVLYVSQNLANITMNITNVGNVNATMVDFNFTVPYGVLTTSISKNTLDVGEVANISWLVNVTDLATTGIFNFSVNVTCAESEEKSIKKEIEIHRNDIIVKQIMSPINGDCGFLELINITALIKNNGSHAVGTNITFFIDNVLKNYTIENLESGAEKNVSYLWKPFNESLKTINVSSYVIYDINTTNNKKSIIYSTYLIDISSNFTIDHVSANVFNVSLRIDNNKNCLLKNTSFIYGVPYNFNISLSNYDTNKSFMDPYEGISYEWTQNIPALSSYLLNFTLEGNDSYKVNELFMYGIK